MTPETAAMRPPRKGPMLRQTSPERRSGLMGTAALSVSSEATQRMVGAVERGEERRVGMAKSLEVKREDMPIGRQAGRSLSDPYNHASGARARPRQSLRNASTGETCDARHAGTLLATTATANRPAATPATLTG